MRALSVFDQVSLDGYFTDRDGDMSWAHRPPDPEWDGYTTQNAQGGGTLVFGRVTYEMMAAFWPTPAAFDTMPEVAEQMGTLDKVVFSTTLTDPGWRNVTVTDEEPAAAIRAMKDTDGQDMVVMGSGTIVSQLADAGLVDSYEIVVIPVILGGGRSLFEGVAERQELKLVQSRQFANGNVVNRYVPAGG